MTRASTRIDASESLRLGFSNPGSVVSRFGLLWTADADNEVEIEAESRIPAKVDAPKGDLIQPIG